MSLKSTYYKRKMSLLYKKDITVMNILYKNDVTAINILYKKDVTALALLSDMQEFAHNIRGDVQA
jgi:hypothetical protein